ncbi:ElyC/SanA/YdcF family protein [Sneathiella limimaris]|uniref:ElyC/SanA/YdcF family protein n=1 Tax=Sneathiella limimaris TaxID=1964213 RepID=UPI00146BD212|nr:ElyC/SanA/YdcF family protein [Sneathiella limimaris]
MLDYALVKLIDGMSLPGVILIFMPVTLILSAMTRRKRYFLANSIILIFLSFPVTGKLLIAPIDVGVTYQDAIAQFRFGDSDSVVVLASGLQRDRETGATLPSMGSFSRVKRAEKLAKQIQAPLLVSGTDPQGQGELPFLMEQLDGSEEVLLTFGAEGTADHAANIATLMQSHKLNSAIVFTTGIHAYRTRAVLEKQGVTVNAVIVGIKDSDLTWTDFVPGFEGFFYWKHGLKEYAGLIAYYWRGLI